MTITVLYGDDYTAIDDAVDTIFGPDRAAGDTERFELADDTVDALVAALTAPSLFGGTRNVLVDATTALSKTAVAALAAASADTDANVIVRTSTAPTKALKAAFGDPAVQDCRVPAAKVAARVTELAREAGVRLDSRAVAAIVERTGGDTSRARHVIDMCVSIGLVAPRVDQVETLAGTGTGADVKPWAVSAAAETGNIAQAFAVADNPNVIPFAALGWLRSRYTNIAVAAELTAATGTPATPEQIAAAAGCTPAAAKSVARAARGVDVAAAHRMAAAVVAGDVAAKSGTADRDALRVTVGTIAAEFAAARQRR